MKKSLPISFGLLLLCLLLIYFNFDFFTSIIPGWHSTINSGWKYAFIIFIILFVFFLIITILIKIFVKIINAILNRRKSQK
jgi:membrane protein implicated in regulation of membrane protease activity